MGCSRKNSHPHNERQLENLMEVGRGVNGSENPDGRGALNLKIQPREVTFDFIDVSIASINPFSTIYCCFAFSNFIILSNYRPLTTFILSFHP